MKNLVLFVFAFFLFAAISHGQKFYTKNGKIEFDATSGSSPEKIEGINRNAICVIDTKSGAIQFSVLMKGFAFERSLMEEHFNENYVESNKFPKAEFKGTITNNTTVNYLTNGTYKVNVIGKLTIHGETKDVAADGTMITQEGKINASADFKILLSDFNISIPGLVADKVSKTARISISCQLEPLKN